jgi:hypothetical protein
MLGGGSTFALHDDHSEALQVVLGSSVPLSPITQKSCGDRPELRFTSCPRQTSTSVELPRPYTSAVSIVHINQHSTLNIQRSTLGLASWRQGLFAFDSFCGLMRYYTFFCSIIISDGHFEQMLHATACYDPGPTILRTHDDGDGDNDRNAVDTPGSLST